MRNAAIIWLFCFVCMVTQLHVSPAAGEEDIYILNETVITATKTPVTLGKVTQKVDVIKNDQIDRRIAGNANIAEMLGYEPGNFASVLSRNDANWGSSGGLPHKYKSYLLDGLPIDSFVDPQSLDVGAFERIEEQRGPASALYPNYLFMDFAGNQSALSGTTNLVLKSRVEAQRSEVQGYYGSYNTFGARFLHQQRVSSLHLVFGGQRETSDYTNYGNRAGSWLNMLDDPQYEKSKIYLAATHYPTNALDHKVSFFVHHTWHRGDVGRPNRDYDHEYTTFQGGYTLPISDATQVMVKVGYRNYERTWENDNYPADLGLSSESGVDQEIVPGDIVFSLSHGDNNILTFGGDFQFAQYQTFSETAVRAVGNDADADQYGLYLQEEMVWDDLVLRIGGRYDHIEHSIHMLNGQPPGKSGESWNEFLWSAGLRYDVMDALSIYANGGSSFLAPSLKSVGGTIKLSDRGVAGRNGHLPNPDLDPETGIGLDIGLDFQAMEQLYIGLRGFHTMIDDQIVQIVVSDDPSQSQDINAGETTSYGLEAELRHRYSDDLEWFANYTYTHSEIQNDLEPDQDGAEVPFVPAHMGNIGVMFSLPHGIRASAYLQLTGSIYDSTSKMGRTEFDGYALFNAKIEKQWVKSEDVSVSVFLDIYNLADDEFEMPWQFQDPGISATGGVRVIF